MHKRLAVASVGVILVALLAACRPPPPPPPPPPGPMTLGWTHAGVTGPITTDAAENLVWATGSGSLWGLDAATGAVAKQYPLTLDGVQHFPTPNIVSNWVVIEKSGRQIAGFPTPANTTGTAWTSVILDGEVQSRPTVVGNTVVVATENDSLYGLNLADGKTIWGPTNFGTPEPLADAQSIGGVSAGCGNITPLGVTSNTVYDSGTGTVYAVGERETLPSPSPHPPEFVMVGVNPATGALTPWTGNLSAPLGADVARQQQRAGLAVGNGNVYVGFGGLVGDCGMYHGLVVAASQADGHVVGSFEAAAVPNSNRGAAVWGTSGPIVDGSGNVYATTGNSFGAPSSGTDYSDAVVKLPSSMTTALTAPPDWFQPPAWRSDNNADLDLGSTGPVFASSTQLFVIGKQHDAFLLNLSSLGGADHSTPVGTINACPGVVMGQNAVLGSSAYVACSNGIRQVHLG